MADSYNEPFPPEVEGGLEDILERIMSRYRIPGAVVGIRIPGRGRWVCARGKSDIREDIDMKPFDKVRIASITKSFTATLILMLVDEGLLGLDGSVGDVLPGVPGIEGVTIRQLGNNTSGLFDYLEDESFQHLIESDPARGVDSRELVDIAMSHEPYFEPGGGYHYSNTNFVLLGLIAEELTGTSMEELVTERIIRPLGLRNTEFPVEPDYDRRFSHGYRPGGDERLEDVTCLNPSIGWAAGGMTSNLVDLETWAGVLGRGDLITEEARRAQLYWVESPDRLVEFERYGFGITAKGEFIGHEGHLLGYNNAMYYLTARDATVVVLFNRYFGEESVAGTAFLFFARSLLPGVFPADRHPAG